MTFPWDELNTLRTKVESLEEITEDGVKTYNREKVLDAVYEYLEYSWTMGVDNVNENLSTSFAVNDKEMRDSINQAIAGKTYRERIAEYADKGDLDSIMRVAETDSNRNSNEAAFLTAKKAGAKYKTWVTMDDERVRATHEYLHAMTIPIDDYFVTFDGDKALHPNGFSKPENNINCRCQLTFA